MYFPVIPNSFICTCVSLCWRDVAWGYERKLVDWRFIVDVAEYFVSRGSVDTLESEILSLGELDIEEIERKLYSLADNEGDRHDSNSQEKWLYIALKWVFENKDDLSDPLGMVELIYADFDYPMEMENFVRYMPCQDGYKPEEHTAQQNIERIFYNWYSYLESVADYFKK